MLDALIRRSLRYRSLVLFLAIALLVGGAYTASNMPLDVLPDLTAPTVIILVEGPGMVPTEMESLATFPIEASMNGAAGVRRVRSATAVGVAIIWVEFDWGQDILRARQIVTEKLAQAARIIGSEPAAIQLRYLQTVTEIASENNSTTIFPIPLDLFRGVLELLGTRTPPAAPALSANTSGETLPASRGEEKVKA